MPLLLRRRRQLQGLYRKGAILFRWEMRTAFFSHPAEHLKHPKQKPKTSIGVSCSPTSAENTAEPYHSPYQGNMDMEHSSSVYDQLQDYMKQFSMTPKR